MTDQDIFYIYEQVLLGKRKNYSSEIFADSTTSGKEEIALRFFKCIMEKYLKWTPEEAYHSLNKEVMEKMKLIPLVRFIRFPPEFDPMQDCFYIVAKAYPTKFTIDEVKQTEIVYKRILNGDVSRFPKFFFEGRDGLMRALFCLKYALKEYGTFKNPDEMYKYFVNNGVQFLKEYKLWDAFVMNFNTYPVDYLHAVFDNYRKCDYTFLYNKYRLIAQYNEQQKNKHKEDVQEMTETA